MDDALGDSAGGQQIGRAGHDALQQLGSAFAVTGQFTAELLGHLGQSCNKGVIVSGAGLDLGAGQAAGQQQHGVVGGGVAVHRDLVEGGGHHAGQGSLQHSGLDLGVGGDEEQHGGHVGVDHAGALGNGAHAAGLAAHGEFDGHLFRMGVGGHNGGGSVVAASLGGGQLGGGLRDALGERLNAHGLADDAGGGGQHVVGADAQLLGDDLAGLLGQLNAVGGAGISVAAVDHDSLGVAVLEMLAIHRDGRTVDLVGGVAAGTGAADVRLDKCQIQLGMVMPDAAMHTGGGETGGCTDAAGDRLEVFHNCLPLIL